MSRTKDAAAAASVVTPDASPLEPRADGTMHVHLKVVPGASKAGLAGRYGDRLKLRVTAAAESGKANKAVLAFLAKALEIPAQDLELVRGASAPHKTVAVRGVAPADIAARLGLPSA